MAAGYSVARLIATASTNATLVKPAPGILGGWKMACVAAYPVFVKLYDSATIPTAGGGIPKMTITILASGSTALYLGGVDPEDAIPFSNGIGFTITKLMPDADTTVLVAGDCNINLFYK